MQLNQLNRVLFGCIMFAAPLSITPWNKFALVGVFLVSALLLVFMLAQSGRLLLNKVPLGIILCYLTMFLVGFLSLLNTSTEAYGVFISGDTLGRLFTVTTLSLMLLSGYVYLENSGPQQIQSLVPVWLLPGAVFVAFGVYQVYCNLTGKPFIIETRDWMHGMPAVIQNALPKRLTSIAEEPSFLAPILIEVLVLTLFVVKREWLRLGFAGTICVLLLLTFSGGAYANAAMLAGCTVAIILWRFKIGKIHFLLLIGAILGLALLFSIGQILIEFAVNKFVHEAEGGSSRAQFMRDLIDLQLNTGFSQLLFGHGLTSMSQLQEFGMRTEEVLFRISNNMFLDILWESGVIGLTLVASMFSILLSQGLQIQKQLQGRLSLSLLLTCQMLITGLYRSEYISTHLVWMLVLVMWAIRWEKQVFITPTSTNQAYNAR